MLSSGIALKLRGFVRRLSLGTVQHSKEFLEPADLILGEPIRFRRERPCEQQGPDWNDANRRAVEGGLLRESVERLLGMAGVAHQGNLQLDVHS